MMTRPMLSDAGCLLLLTLAVLTVCVNAYNDDRPIFKWSPNFFNSYYRRSMYKRFNEDQPFYKWSPRWFYRYAGTFKRSVPEEDALGLCASMAAPCRSGGPPCCASLQCLPASGGPRCQPADGVPDDLSAESDSAEGDNSSDLIQSDWYRNGPPPFFPRSWA